MKSLHQTAIDTARSLVDAMPMVATLPEGELFASFIGESLRHQFGAQATHLEAYVEGTRDTPPEGHVRVEDLSPAQETMKKELLGRNLFEGCAVSGLPPIGELGAQDGVAFLRKPGALSEQVGGTHYKGMKIQHAEFCQVNRLTWCESAAIKYLVRHREKNRIEDLKKAMHYIRICAKLDYGVEL